MRIMLEPKITGAARTIPTFQSISVEVSFMQEQLQNEFPSIVRDGLLNASELVRFGSVAFPQTKSLFKSGPQNLLLTTPSSRLRMQLPNEPVIMNNLPGSGSTMVLHVLQENTGFRAMEYWDDKEDREHWRSYLAVKVHPFENDWTKTLQPDPSTLRILVVCREPIQTLFAEFKHIHSYVFKDAQFHVLKHEALAWLLNKWVTLLQGRGVGVDTRQMQHAHFSVLRNFELKNVTGGAFLMVHYEDLTSHLRFKAAWEKVFALVGFLGIELKKNPGDYHKSFVTQETQRTFLTDSMGKLFLEHPEVCTYWESLMEQDKTLLPSCYTKYKKPLHCQGREYIVSI